MRPTTVVARTPALTRIPFEIPYPPTQSTKPPYKEVRRENPRVTTPFNKPRAIPAVAVGRVSGIMDMKSTHSRARNSSEDYTPPPTVLSYTPQWKSEKGNAETF